jgi:hypothetical protein
MTLETLLAVLNTAVLGLSGWTLYTVHGLAKLAAAQRVKDEAQDATLDEDRARIIDVERDVAVLKTDVAVLKERRG